MRCIVFERMSGLEGLEEEDKADADEDDENGLNSRHACTASSDADCGASLSFSTCRAAIASATKPSAVEQLSDWRRLVPRGRC